MKMLIAGEWVDKKEKIEVRDPWDGSVVDTVPGGTAEDLDRAIGAAVDGYRINRDLPVHERKGALRRVPRSPLLMLLVPQDIGRIRAGGPGNLEYDR